MDFIKTFFQKDAKCNNCQCNFTVSMKRRQCRVCSNVNIDLFFCKQCSQVVRHKYLKILKSKRYCNTCYNSQTFHKISVSTETPRAKSAFNKKLKNTVKIIKQDPLKHYSLLFKNRRRLDRISLQGRKDFIRHLSGSKAYFPF